MIPETFASRLHHCSKTKALGYGLSLHAAAVKAGMLFDVFISNHVVNMYAKCGIIKSARRVFDEMSERNLVTWAAMISGYDQAGKPLLAVELFSQLRLRPNEFVFSSAISACASLLALRTGEQIHAQSVKYGCSSICFVSNSLVSMYMKCGQSSDALSVFATTSEPTSVSYNAVIAGLMEGQQAEKGLEAFKLMCRQGFIPDRFTYVAVFGYCISAEDLVRGMGFHCQTIKLNLDSSAFIGNVMMTMYSTFNLIDEAEKIFRDIQEKDVISWNTFITACCHCDEHVKGLSVFSEMLNGVDVNPDDFTYSSALTACAGIASLPQGKQVHAHLIKTRLYDDIGVDNALVNMYSKCGSIMHAYTVFKQKNYHNVVSWNSIITGFANHGLGKKSLELFGQMIDGGTKPDSVTFIGLLTACNHAGLVDEGIACFNSLNEIYGISPSSEHLSCLIDLLGRAGRLKEAEEYLKKYSHTSDPVILGCLLSACRLHGDVELGNRTGKLLLEAQPTTTSPYVLLSNLCASDAMWGNVAEVRKMLKVSGLKKEPGHSLIEVEGIMEKFTVGKFSHSRISEILDVLNLLGPSVDEECFV
ncbi:Pentatricopeptide repeat-containing protein [Heracleum sosnowskyi]|uniref:Pentatricopeptide repeat-containing protein n=1 Tax=Heracleum sosnowskyi TaxID=360622 RepID=A0AAD8IET5_9APIA|nr:Pentatricopeptide repeat-containing protein [Heracleum sosnowskyi]